MPRSSVPRPPGRHDRRRVPIEPPLSPWDFPTGDHLEGLADGDLVALGADLQPGTLLAAYRSGLFPMPPGRHELGWWFARSRAACSRSTGCASPSHCAARARDFEIRVDTAFDEVVAACADPGRDGGWITPAIHAAYARAAPARLGALGRGLA